jgi:UPF0755 protein
MGNKVRMKFRLIFFLLVVIFLLGIIALWFQNSVKPLDTKSSDIKVFVIRKGEPMRSIATRLHSEGLIKNAVSFFIFVKALRIEKQLQAGDFKLSPSMSASEIVDALQHGSLDVWITFPEGWRIEQVAQRLNEELGVDRDEFIKIADEGYMFPDTYLMPKNATASQAAVLMKNTFDKKVLTLIENDNRNDLTSSEIIILASLIEREAKNTEDRPIVASVLLNRLNLGMKLDIDATVQYVKANELAKQHKASWESFDWWPDVLRDDLQYFSSPFNTYIQSGLPPKPIANPGIESIRAVVDPAKTDYLYYISDENGMNHYAKTYEEHLKNIQTYLQ